MLTSKSMKQYYSHAEKCLTQDISTKNRWENKNILYFCSTVNLYHSFHSFLFSKTILL